MDGDPEITGDDGATQAENTTQNVRSTESAVFPATQAETTLDVNSSEPTVVPDDLDRICNLLCPSKMDDRTGVVFACMLITATFEEDTTIAQIFKEGKIKNDMQLLQALLELEDRIRDLLIDELEHFNAKVSEIPKALADPGKVAEFETLCTTKAFQMLTIAAETRLPTQWLPEVVEGTSEATAKNFGIVMNANGVLANMKNRANIPRQIENIRKFCQQLDRYEVAVKSIVDRLVVFEDPPPSRFKSFRMKVKKHFE